MFMLVLSKHSVNDHSVMVERQHFSIPGEKRILFGGYSSLFIRDCTLLMFYCPSRLVDILVDLRASPSLT